MELRTVILLCALCLCVGGVFGWKLYNPHMVVIPTGAARLEVPKGCKSRDWMNGVEVDCPGAAPTMYYVGQLKEASPK